MMSNSNKLLKLSERRVWEVHTLILRVRQLLQGANTVLTLESVVLPGELCGVCSIVGVVRIVSCLAQI